MKAKPYIERIAVPTIIAVSVIVPLVVFYLMYASGNLQISSLEHFDFPFFHATINFITGLLLVLGFFSIRIGRRIWHRNLMMSAFLLSCVFLVSYVLSKSIHDPVPYGGEGFLRYVYFFILITHILISAGIIPLVLFTIFRAWRGQLDRHRKIARYTYPLWLYVAITGVLVYVFMAPYY